MEDLKQELKELLERKEELENCDNEEEYDNMLDCEGDIEIMGMKYLTSRVLKEVDPIAYHCGHTDYNDSFLSDIEAEIENKLQEIKNYQN